LKLETLLHIIVLQLMIIEDMGHCLLAPHWALVADAVAELARYARHSPLSTT
jgi:hypothetical protein